MRTILCALVFFALTSPLRAQESRVEVTQATTPAEDSKPNNDAVPNGIALNGQFGRIVVLRFKYGSDLLGEMQTLIKTQKIRNAVILSAAGSVSGYHYHTVSNGTFPSKNIFVKNPTGPADLIGMNGYVIDGRIHAHMTLANPDKAFGGHLEPGTTVFTFAIVTLGVLKEGIDLSRIDDKTYR
ncbi:MAG TPA: PPC domain-containing DNA-binding protein [Bacteroidota bacterium]|nr:PPC domain-containing DNA-binding protein [Bacteroidota bacterium]